MKEKKGGFSFGFHLRKKVMGGSNQQVNVITPKLKKKVKTKNTKKSMKEFIKF